MQPGDQVPADRALLSHVPMADGILDEKLCPWHAAAARMHWWFLARRAILQQLLAEILPVGQTRLVVEVGCGTGENIQWLQQMYHAVGVDPSGVAIQWARQHVPHGHFICGYAPYDVPQLPQADAVLLLDVLEHVKNDVQLWQEVVDAVKPGCFFLVTVPAEKRLWSGHDEVHGHFRRYERDELIRMIETAPVELLLESYFNRRLYWPVRIVRRWSRWKGRSLGPCRTDLWLPPHWLNDLLARVFAGEARSLIRSLRAGIVHTPWRRGVSLIAVAKRRA